MKDAVMNSWAVLKTAEYKFNNFLLQMIEYTSIHILLKISDYTL